jgi:anti-anti-sigma regulatory factor
MLKITGQKNATQASMSIILEGKLAGPWVEELNTYWCQISGNRQSDKVIDLTGVTFIDADGKELLTKLWQQGAELRAAGCLTRCVVEEITGAGRVDSSCSTKKVEVQAKVEKKRVEASFDLSGHGLADLSSPPVECLIRRAI